MTVLEHSDLIECAAAAGTRVLPRGAADFFDRIEDSFYILDEQGRFVFINAIAAERWGRERSPLLGQVMTEAFPQARDSDPALAHDYAARHRCRVSVITRSPVLCRLAHIAVRPVPGGLSVAFREISELDRHGRILVVEDDQIVRDILVSILESAGFTIVTARTMAEAAAAVALLPVDAILLDDALPGGHGSSLMRPAAEAGIPTILMSGYLDTIEARKGNPLFLPKPFGIEDGFEKISRLLKPYRQVAERRMEAQRQRVRAEKAPPDQREAYLQSAEALDAAARAQESAATAQLLQWTSDVLTANPAR